MQNIQGVDGSGFVVHVIEDNQDIAHFTQTVVLGAFPMAKIQLYWTKEAILSALDSHSWLRVYIVDWSFPSDMNSATGLWWPTVYKEIKARHLKIPVIGLTGYAKDFTKLWLDSFEKPVAPDEIVNWVRKSFLFLLAHPEALDLNPPKEITSEPIPQNRHIELSIGLEAPKEHELSLNRSETFFGKILRRLWIK